VHDDAAERLGVYRRIVDLVEASLRDLVANRVQNKLIWASMKAAYSGLIAEPWFHVNDDDIFPQEFVHFLGLSDNLRISFSRYHGDLFDVSSWRQTQDRLLAGEQVHIFPYARSLRIHA
jgi:isocitrate dehydrogenase kinase/phosphatase